MFLIEQPLPISGTLRDTPTSSGAQRKRGRMPQVCTMASRLLQRGKGRTRSLLRSMLTCAWPTANITIFLLARRNAAAVVLAILHERMDLMERLKNRLSI